jgi:hypothetical protein
MMPELKSKGTKLVDVMYENTCQIPEKFNLFLLFG